MLECSYEAIENGMFEQLKRYFQIILNPQKRVLRYTHLLGEMLECLPPNLSLNMRYSSFGILKPYQCSRRPDVLTL